MKTNIELPLVNIRDFVFFPGVEQTMYIGREMTITAIRRAANQRARRVIVVTQKKVQEAKPKSLSDMFDVGTVCSIKKCILLADGTMKVLLRAERRAMVLRLFERESIRYALAKPLKETKEPHRLSDDERKSLLELLVRWNPDVAVREDNETFLQLHKERDSRRFLNSYLGLIATPKVRNVRRIGKALVKNKLSRAQTDFINVGMKARQAALEESSVSERIKTIRKILLKELISH